ncbi:hypothetical protein [Candidatus Laterigemmans baculatus]|uniref:hypothetical protein n=1 Tax=Candidatus Laterigemmans baculatus TaxID=2770505 RepID=UPI0013D9CAD8|nr:hypothetical protein [Candidatus Laterigemmans baculatus]
MTAAGTGARPGPGTSYRLRGDLEIHPRERAGRRQYWLAHPISGRVVRLAGEDYRGLVGRVDRGGAVERLPAADPALLAEARAAGLVAGERPATAVRARSGWWRNPLYIRLSGVPADGVGAWLAKRTSWLFSAVGVTFWGLVIAVVAVALLAHAGELVRRLDPLVTFQAKHWGLALATLAITKGIHELAHAAVCRRMGAAAREIGVLLLCGTPCLYCDVTDSWRVDSRLRRAAIMLAGVYIESVLAALAGVVWLLSEDGFLRMAALNLICVCGVSTVLFNINPLMRYDGYFVLADFLDVPNLRSRAVEAWRSAVVRRVAGASYQSGTFGGSGAVQWGLAAFHLASTGYRYVVLSALLGWGYLVLSRAGVESLARGAIVVGIAGFICGQANRLWQVGKGRGAWSGVSAWRRWGIASGWTLLAGLILWVPVERRVTARGVVELHAATNVYAPRSGRVERIEVEYGNAVEQGATLALLDEPALRIERVRLTSQLEELRIRSASLRRRALADPELLDQLEEQSAAIAATEDQRRAVETAIGQLHLTAPRSGTLLPYVAPSHGGGESSSGSGAGVRAAAPAAAPRLSTREGQTIPAGSVWCCVGDERSKQVVLEVDAAQRRFIERGGEVQVRLDPLPAEIVTCQVADVSAIRHDPRSFAELVPRNRFAVACRLPEEMAARVPIGSTATGVFRGEPLRLWDWCLSRITGAAL